MENLVESLMVDSGLKPAVVNVLIDYVMKINNKKLTKNFVETIAGQWKRLNIETAEDAMNEAEKECKKKKMVKEKRNEERDEPYGAKDKTERHRTKFCRKSQTKRNDASNA